MTLREWYTTRASAAVLDEGEEGGRTKTDVLGEVMDAISEP